MGVDRVQIHENIRTLIDILLRIYGVWYTKYFEISLTLLMRLDQHGYIGKVCNKMCEGHNQGINISVFLMKNKIVTWKIRLIFVSKFSRHSKYLTYM